MSNNTTFHEDPWQPTVRLSLLPIVLFFGTTSLGFIANFVFTAICLKTLQKTFHNLFVIFICTNDGFLTFVCCIFVLTQARLTNVTICHLYCILIIYGFNCSYFLIFLIATIRFLNFVLLKKPSFYLTIESHKYKLLAFVHLFALILAVCTNSLPRHNQELKNGCTGFALYGEDYYQIFLIISYGLPTLLLLFTIIMYAVICFQIVIHLYETKNRVQPLSLSTKSDNQATLKDSLEEAKSSMEMGIAMSIKRKSGRETQALKMKENYRLSSKLIETSKTNEDKLKHCSFEHDKRRRGAHEAVVDIEDISDENVDDVITLENVVVTTDQFTHGCQSYKTPGAVPNEPSISLPVDDENIEPSEGALKSRYDRQRCKSASQRQTLKSPLQVDEGTLDGQDYNEPTSLNRTKRGTVGDQQIADLSLHQSQVLVNRNKFEIRACVTSFLIACTTFFFTGSYLFTIWHDILSTDVLPQHIRYISFISNAISYFLDPFIYAWRVPSIRKELAKNLRKVFCRYNTQAQED